MAVRACPPPPAEPPDRLDHLRHQLETTGPDTEEIPQHGGELVDALIADRRRHQDDDPNLVGRDPLDMRQLDIVALPTHLRARLLERARGVEPGQQVRISP
jgi:hypothetical protein